MSQFKTIAMIGVGSTYFTRALIESLVRVGGGWDVRMVDIDQRALSVAMRLGQRIVELYQADIRITGSTDRLEILAGCDTVISTIGVGGRTGWLEDLKLGRRHGVNQTTADTFGLGGLSRALRTIPALVDIAQDMERLCPTALLVNFSNPMTVNCRAVTKATKIRSIGLCTGVRHFHHLLARELGFRPEDTWCTAQGVNHFTWITSLTHASTEFLPRIAARSSVPGGRFTGELFETFGAFPVVGDHHISEFFPNLLGKNRFYGATLGFDGEKDSAAEYIRSYDRTEAEMTAEADGSKPITRQDLHDPNRQFGDEDLFAELLLALRGEGQLACTMNLPNRGQMSQVQSGAIVETTVLVNGAGIHPLVCPDMPVGVNAIVQRLVAVQELVAEAGLRGDRTLAVQSLLADLTARTKAEAEAMVDDILATHRANLPAFAVRKAGASAG